MCGKKDRDIKIGEKWQIKDCEWADFYWDCVIKQQEILVLFILLTLKISKWELGLYQKI